jgi:protein-tyrosine phosphatase
MPPSTESLSMTTAIPTPILACAPNFRDIGGYAGADGATVHAGRIYRSQLIARPTEDDRAALRRIAIRYVCDLRGTHERESAPNQWLEEPLPVLSHLDIGMDVRAGAGELLGIIAADPTVNGIRAMMMRTYSLLPGAFAGKLGAFLDAILAGGSFPALIHCTAGKDRTGFVTAMLLLSLGVSREQVHYDYALTEKFIDMERMMAASAHYLTSIVGDQITPSTEMLRLLCGTSPDYLEAAFAAIDKDYGSVDGYLEKTAGFDADKRVALRRLMLG